MLDTSRFEGDIAMETRELDASRVEVGKEKERARMLGVRMGQGV